MFDRGKFERNQTVKKVGGKIPTGAAGGSQRGAGCLGKVKVSD